MKRLTRDEVEREIAGLDGMTTQQLQARWRTLYKRDPPARMRSGFLRRGIAYRLQERAFGGLKPATVRLLRKLAAELRAERERKVRGVGRDEGAVVPLRAPTKQRILSSGSQLLREWNGSTEIVKVVTDGFQWRGKPYRTLSAVAVAITGTKWSGPRFFGLVAPVRGSAKRAQRSPLPTNLPIPATATRPS